MTEFMHSQFYVAYTVRFRIFSTLTNKCT